MPHARGIRSELETVVVGAGISGLAYAHARGPEADLVVLEASERAGGWMHTLSEQGYRFELGPEAPLGGAGALNELARTLDVPIQPAPAARKRFLELDQKLVEIPASPERLATSPLLSMGGKLRLMAEPAQAAGEALDGSIADFARHRLGAEALERLVDPFVAGVHAGLPEQLSLRACFPEVVRLVEQHGSLFAALSRKGASAQAGLGGELGKPRGGMGTLARALSAALGGRLALSEPVLALEPDGRGFRVHTGTGRELLCRLLVLATDLASAARLLSPLAPSVAAALATMKAESLVAVLHGHERRSVEHALDGFGYLVPRAAGKKMLGTLFASTIDPECAPAGHVLLRSLLGGARHPELVELGDDELCELALQECARPLGLRGTPVFTRVLRYREALPRFDLEHPARQRLLARELPPGLSVLGNFTRGIGVGRLAAEACALANPG
jgi:oxygen-dependent protoporphyrinogen oxidase